MSNDAKKDILKAVQDAQNTKNTDSGDIGKLPPPKYLKHSLNEEGTYFTIPLSKKDE